jgi:heme exporter protein D
MLSIAERTVCSMCLSYAAFFPLAWFLIKNLVDNSQILVDVAERDESIAPHSPQKRSASRSSWPEFFIPDAFGEFAAFVVLILALVAIAMMVSWIVLEGPVIFVDIVFDLALASGLVRSARTEKSEGLVGILFRKTCIPFMVILAINLIVVQSAHIRCPGNTRLSEMIRDCKRGRSF